jgi:hypothetical protein
MPACFSAFPYIVAGGVERIVSRSARVGVHQHYHGENVVLPAFLAVDQSQRGQGRLLETGVSPLLAAKAMQTPPDEIYVLLESELTGLALATAMDD